MVDTFTLLNSRIKQYMYTCKRWYCLTTLSLSQDHYMKIVCIYGVTQSLETWSKTLHTSLYMFLSTYIYTHTHIYIYIYIYNVLYIMMPITFQDTQDLEKEHNHLNLSD